MNEHISDASKESFDHCWDSCDYAGICEVVRQEIDAAYERGYEQCEKEKHSGRIMYERGREDERERVQQVLKNNKKKTLHNMLQDDATYEQRGMDGVKGWNDALKNIFNALDTNRK